MRSSEIRARSRQLAGRWRRYDPPGMLGTLAGDQFTEASIRRFVTQLRDPTMQVAMLDLLDEFILVARDELRQRLEPLLATVAESTGGLVALAPLGGPGESGAYVVYSLGDVLRRHDSFEPVWIGELSTRHTALVLVDDLIWSASRTLGYLAGWMQIPLPGASPTRPQPLPDALVRLVKSLPVTAAYAFGRSSDYAGVEAVVRGRDVQLTIMVGDSEPCTIHRWSMGRPDRDALTEELRRVGSHILMSHGFTPAAAADRALGHSNAGLLMATVLSTPVQTVTALSTGGLVDGRAWYPLFPRLTSHSGKLRSISVAQN